MVSIWHFFETYNEERLETIREKQYRKPLGCDAYQDLACVYTTDGVSF